MPCASNCGKQLIYTVGNLSRPIDWQTGEQFLNQNDHTTSPFFSYIHQLYLRHVHQSLGPFHRCTLTKDEQSGDILSQGSPLMGHSTVIVPGSGAWV